MARIVLGIIAVVACFMLVESLKCNKCSYGIMGYCSSNSEVTCGTNTSVCFTGKASFTAIPSAGFNTQDCREPAGCNATTNSTLVGIAYSVKIDCCSADKCNPVQLSGATTTKMSFTVAAGVAVLASVFGSIL